MTHQEADEALADLGRHAFGFFSELSATINACFELGRVITDLERSVFVAARAHFEAHPPDVINLRPDWKPR